MKKGSFYKNLSMALIIPMLLTGCGKNKKEAVVLPPIEPEKPDSYTEELYLNKARLSELASQYSDYFEEYPVEYKQIESYLSNEQIDQIIEYSNVETHCERRYELDPELFFDILKENSEKYVAEHSEFRIPFLEEPYIEEHVVDFETNLRYTIDTIIAGKNDIYEDLHQIEKLTIVFGNASKFYSNSQEDKRYYLVYASEDDSVILGVYDSHQNIIVVDDEAISLISSMYYDLEDQYQKFNDILLETIQHEFNHVRQKACEDRVAQGLVLDNMFVYDGSYISTISEASAESELYMMGKYPPGHSMQFGDYVYEGERADELLLLTLALCNEDAEIEDYYNAIADTDYASLYNFYDLRSREEIYDFYHIVYSIDSKNFRNNLWEKIYNEEEITEKTYFDYTVDIGYSYRVDIFRMVLEKLTKFTDKKGTKLFPLKDNLAVFNILKDIVVKNAYEYYEDDSNPEMIRYRKYYEEYMVENIVALENAYVEFLSDYYEVPVSEIRHIESTELQEYIQTLINVANYEYTDQTKDKEALKLFSKFPILSSILKKRYLSYFDYFDFVEDNKEFIYSEQATSLGNR